MDDSFAKGLRVLETLVGAEQPLGLTQIADKTGLIKSHTHKYLQTLIQHRYVEQLYSRGPYRLSLKLLGAWDAGARTHRPHRRGARADAGDYEQDRRDLDDRGV